VEPIRQGLFETHEDGSGYLLTNRCERCGKSFFPRRHKCTDCLKEDQLRNTTLSTRGRLYTYTTVYRVTPGFRSPLMIGYVDYEEEGIRVFSQLGGCKPEDLQIGMEMELFFEEMDVEEPAKRKLVYKYRPVRKS
jgi:uncharacterized OB-fold protein